MSHARGSRSGDVVDWGAGERRRHDLEAELEAEFSNLRSRAAPLDQFYVATRYPNSLPGGIPAQAFARPEAERALEMAREVIAAVRHRLAPAK